MIDCALYGRLNQWLGQTDFTVMQINQKLQKVSYEDGCSILASAILDRLSNHCFSIVLEGESYRPRKMTN